MDTVIINRTSRILSGHLWVFSNELATSPKTLKPGGLSKLTDKTGKFLGVAYTNPNSLIAARILTRDDEHINMEFFIKRMTNAFEYRKTFVKGNTFRAVFSEGDLLPGLIIDKYENTLSMQFLTLGMDTLSELVIQAAEAVFSPVNIVIRNDSSSRTLEGLPLEKKIIKGNLDKLPVVNLSGSVFEVDPLAGQKTGFFLDQAENRVAFAGLLKDGQTGLDLFCHTGAWGIEAAKRGAIVTGVDSSDVAVLRAKANAELNNTNKNCAFIKADVFDFIKTELAHGKLYDFIVIDPPAFVRSKANLKNGLRAYRDINSAVMKLAKHGAFIATSSCSYHVDRSAFIEILRGAAKDAGKTCRIVETRAQAKDHPVALFVPETEYLKCVILQIN